MPQPIIALTRPLEGSTAFARKLAGVPARILIAPLQEIRPIDDDIRLGADDILIFSSSAGIRIVTEQGALTGRDVYVVGAQSAATAKKAGARVLAQAPTARDLADRIMRDRPERPCHYLHGTHISFDMQKTLISAGLETVSTRIYDQTELPPSGELLAAFDGDRPVILPLFSMRSAAILAHTTAERRSTAALYPVSISAAVDATLQGASMTSRLVAASPDADAMMAEIRALVATFD